MLTILTLLMNDTSYCYQFKAAFNVVEHAQNKFLLSVFLLWEKKQLHIYYLLSIGQFINKTYQTI